MVSAAPLPDFIPDRVVPATVRDPVELWVYSAQPKEGWVPHSPGDLVRIDQPGTAIDYRDKVYELLCAEEIVEGNYPFRYGLRPWQSQYTIRRLVHYTLQSQMDAAMARQQTESNQRLRSLIIWLFPLTGLAPDGLQQEWEKRTGLNMLWVAVGSAFMVLALAFALRHATANSHVASVVLYLLVESFARLLWMTFTRRPRGSFLLTLPYRLWRALQPGRPPDVAIDFATPPTVRQDEVRRPGGALQVHSWYFDSALTGPSLVAFDGEFYRPLRWHQEGKGLRRRWIYDLEKVEPQVGAPSREYTRPRNPERQKEVERFTRRFDLAHSFALLWSTYPRPDQRSLQRLYQYDAPASTALTAGVFLAMGILQLGVIAAFHRAEILVLAAPSYLIAESIYRLYKAKLRHEPAGSLIGYVLRLVIHPPG